MFVGGCMSFVVICFMCLNVSCCLLRALFVCRLIVHVRHVTLLLGVELGLFLPLAFVRCCSLLVFVVYVVLFVRCVFLCC